MSKLKVLALIFVFLCPASLFADQIVLKNGDRLTGTIEQSDGKSLVIKTEFAGEVTVQWPAVAGDQLHATSACDLERWQDGGRNRDHFRRQPGGGHRQCRDGHDAQFAGRQAVRRSRASGV